MTNKSSGFVLFQLDPVPVGDVARTVLERKLERAGTAQERREIKLQLGRLHKVSAKLVCVCGSNLPWPHHTD